jgi:hypothetical protein
MQFTRLVTLIHRWVVWLKDLQVDKVSKPLGAAASADTIRCWELEVGVLDDIGVTVSIVVVLVTPDTIMMMTTNVETDTTLAPANLNILLDVDLRLLMSLAQSASVYPISIELLRASRSKTSWWSLVARRYQKTRSRACWWSGPGLAAWRPRAHNGIAKVGMGPQHGVYEGTEGTLIGFGVHLRECELD